MERLNTDIIAEMHTGKLKMTREGNIWTDEERKGLPMLPLQQKRYAGMQTM